MPTNLPTPESLIEKYAKPVPRYTSYPTAPHFHSGVDSATYKGWLGELQSDQTVSLYTHIPFCDTLCWFCGCHTKFTQKYQPVRRYLPTLMKEITAVAQAAKGNPIVTRLHWGGGSPTILKPEDIKLLAEHTKSAFRCSDDLEFSIEIDPRDLTDAQLDAMAEAGMTRASMGVQDFNPHVQQLINRVQTYEETRYVIEALRTRGVRSLNLDVMYGLPEQTLKDVQNTVEKVISLNPDRISFFGYAHVPWMKKHQTMIAEESLPGVHERFKQAQWAAELLSKAGFTKIGFDHFAKPGDSLAIAAAENRLARNFQGYTEDDADALIGFGASAIGKMPQGYVQNTVATGEYLRQVEEGQLPIAKGYALSDEDKLRAHVIERLMCDNGINGLELLKRFGDSASPILAELDDLALEESEDFFHRKGNCYQVSDEGRPFIRSIAANFDTFLAGGKGRHSIAV